MKIYDLKINGLTDPVGYIFDDIEISWKVKDSDGIKQADACVEIALDKDFSEILHVSRGNRLDSLGVPVELDLKPYTRYYCRVTVTTDAGEAAVSDTCFFETAKQKDKWTARWIGVRGDDDRHPEFVKNFSVIKRVSRARLYITGLGLFEAYINGQKAGNDFLAPFINDYTDNVQHCTYDVTDMIKSENDISILLGNGWYKGRFGFDGSKGCFGDKFALIAELKIDFEDGSSDIIVTDETWKYRESFIDYSDIYGGEIQNFLKYNASEIVWKGAVYTETDHRLSARYSLPLHEMEEIKVKEVIITPAGETVLDMGQNFAGYIEFDLDVPAGETLILEFGEILQNGNFYRENYRTAKSRFTYISDGRSRIVRPHFTFFGFRYVKVTGLKSIDPDSFMGKAVYSEMDRTGFIESSHGKLNRLYDNTLWGLKSNFLDMPTDCPQRDERLGWTGDAQVFCRTAGFHMNTAAFYRKYLKDLRSDQLRNDGAVALYLPNTVPGSTAGIWGDAATIIPDMLYEYYASETDLRNNFPLMKDWVNYIHRKDIERGRRDLFDFGFQLGDWLALDGSTENSKSGGTEHGYIASMYYYLSSRITSNAASILGYDEDASYYDLLAESIREAVLKEYFSPNGRLCIDTQTGYLLSLKTGIFRKRDNVINGLLTRLKKDCYRIKGGFVGATIMATVLADNGLEDIAYDLLFNEKFPGWMYAVNLGATTIWERWNSVMPDGSISSTEMNSLNHYSYGAICEFLYRNAAGIRAASPGFRTAVLSPLPNNSLKFLNCSYESASGRYVSNWRINDDGTVTLHFEIPFGCNAVIDLPRSGKKPFSADSGIYDFTYMPEKDYRYPFNENTRIEKLAENEEARKIIREKLPVAYNAIVNNDIELMTKSLADIKPLFFLGYDPRMVQETIDLVSGIKDY